MFVLLSNYSKMMRVCRKSSKMIIKNVLLQNSQIQHRSCFGDPLGLKMIANVLLVTEESMQKSMRKHCRITSFKKQKQCLEKSERFIFQYINATPYKSIFTKIYLITRKVSNLAWPALTSSFNIIKNVILHMKNQMTADVGSPPRSKQQLIHRLFEEWRKIPEFFIKQLYASISK